MSKQSRKKSRAQRKRRSKARKEEQIRDLAGLLQEVCPWEPGPPVPKPVVFEIIAATNGMTPQKIQRLWPATKTYLASQDRPVYIRQIRSVGGGIFLTRNVHAAIDAEDFGEKVIRGSVRRRKQMRRALAGTGAAQLPDIDLIEKARLPNGSIVRD